MKKLMCPLTGLLLAILLLPGELQAQFKEESARAAYELRMQGEIHYAAAMLEKLRQQGKQENGLVAFEMSRLREHQRIGGARWATADMIIGFSVQAVKRDPDKLLFAYHDASCRFGKAYMSVMGESETAGEDVADFLEKSEKVLVLDPDFHELRVQLVEAYAMLPKNMGGDPAKAEKYALYLEEKDPWFGMLARDVMLPEGKSRVEYWSSLMKDHEKDIRVKVKLGKAYLLEGKIDESRPLLEEAINTDPKYHILMVETGRYHMYQAMRYRDKAESELPLAEAAYERYLASSPEPPAHMQAWVKGHLSSIKRFGGDQQAADELAREAKMIDPFFSKASGLPDMRLYVPPDEVFRSGDYISFLRPF